MSRRWPGLLALFLLLLVGRQVLPSPRPRLPSMALVDRLEPAHPDVFRNIPYPREEEQGAGPELWWTLQVDPFRPVTVHPVDALAVPVPAWLLLVDDRPVLLLKPQVVLNPATPLPRCPLLYAHPYDPGELVLVGEQGVWPLLRGDRDVDVARALPPGCYVRGYLYDGATTLPVLNRGGTLWVPRRTANPLFDIYEWGAPGMVLGLPEGPMFAVDYRPDRGYVQVFLDPDGLKGPLPPNLFFEAPHTASTPGVPSLNEGILTVPYAPDPYALWLVWSSDRPDRPLPFPRPLQSPGYVSTMAAWTVRHRKGRPQGYTAAFAIRMSIRGRVPAYIGSARGDVSTLGLRFYRRLEGGAWERVPCDSYYRLWDVPGWILAVQFVHARYGEGAQAFVLAETNLSRNLTFGRGFVRPDGLFDRFALSGAGCEP